MNEAYTGSRNEAYGTSSLVWVAPNTYLGVKTVIKTISIADAGSTDDFQFASVANINAQARDLGAIIPAYAEILSAQLRCFESVDGSGSKVVSLTIGTSSGGSQILSALDIDSANDMSTTGAGAAPEVAAANATRNIWINATPTANWDTLTAGRWAVIITYVDYGEVYTERNP